MKDRSIEFKVMTDILASNDRFRQQVLEIIENGGFEASDFQDLEYQKMWRSIESMLQRGRSITLDSVQAEMLLGGETNRLSKKTKGALALVASTAVTPDELADNFRELRRTTYVAKHKKVMAELQQLLNEETDASQCAAISMQMAEADTDFQMAMRSTGNLTPQELQAIAIDRNLLRASKMAPTLQLVVIRDLAQKYRIKQVELRENMERLVMLTKEHRVLTEDDIINYKRQELRFLIPDMLPVAESIIISAASGVGKSNMLAALIKPLIEGGEFAGREIEGGKKILYISSDESMSATMNRMEDSGVTDSVKMRRDRGEIGFFEIWEDFNAANRELLCQKLEEMKPDVVIMDSLTTIFPGSDQITQNQSGYGRLIKDTIDDCNNAGAALVVVHHNSKREGAAGIDKLAGSHQIAARFWGVVALSRVDAKNPADPKRKLSMEKCREGQEWSSEITINPRDRWLAEGVYSQVFGPDEENVLNNRDRLLETIKSSPSPICSAEAAERSEVPISSVYRLLGQLESAGLVWRDRQPFGKTWFYGVPGVHQKFDKTVQEAESVVEVEPVDPATAEAMATAATIAAATPEDRWDVVRELPEAELSAAIDHLPADMVEEVMVLASDECEGWAVGDRGIYNTLDDEDSRYLIKEFSKDAFFAATYGKECVVKRWRYERFTKSEKLSGARDGWRLVVVFDDAGEHSKQAISPRGINHLRSPQAVS